MKSVTRSTGIAIASDDPQVIATAIDKDFLQVEFNVSEAGTSAKVSGVGVDVQDAIASITRVNQPKSAKVEVARIDANAVTQRICLLVCLVGVLGAIGSGILHQILSNAHAERSTPAQIRGNSDSDRLRGI